MATRVVIPGKVAAVMLTAFVAVRCGGGSTSSTESGDRPRATADGPIACADLLKAPPSNVMLTHAIAAKYYERVAETSGSADARRAEEQDKAASRENIPNCSVTGLIDGTIRFELLMPDAWNGKFLMGGGGGFVGSVQNATMDKAFTGGKSAIERGYATAGTDTGHQGSSLDARWALGNPQARENFAHRAMHRTADVAKQIIASHYGRKIERSYFSGCSRGGGHALILAQRYPEDFDGIIAGAPAFDWTGMVAEFLRNQQAVFPDPYDVTSPVVTPDNLKLLVEGWRKRCDAIDGVPDGILTDPRRCTFDPAGLPRCTAEPKPNCLTKQQLAAIQTIYADTVAGGTRLYPGFPFGGESDPGNWDRWITRGAAPVAPGMPNIHFALGTEFAKYFVFEDPNWTYANFDFAGWRERTAAQAQLLNATSTDLRRFRARGGKLIMWHGWSDAALPAARTLEYYEAVVKQEPGAESFVKLYMMPGVGHCRGGAGPDRADWIATLEAWVERGTAPGDIIATKVNQQGAVTLERPLCPYPQVAQYNGTGNVNVAASFRCVPPSR